MLRTFIFVVAQNLTLLTKHLSVKHQTENEGLNPCAEIC